MLRHPGITRALLVTAMAAALSVSARATTGASRTFVATTGSDSNVTANCGATTPCRTFGIALSVTNPGGEMVVLTSGGYGPASITLPVIITAVGVDASISVTTSGAAGLTINTSGNVTLIGLNLHGEASGANGVLVSQVSLLRLYNMLIENFTNDGIDFNANGKLAVYNSTVDNNAEIGLQVEQGLAYVSASDFDNNGHGVEIDAAGQGIVADSTSNLNFGGFLALGGTLTLFNDRAVFSNTALISEFDGKLFFGDCLIAGNATAYNVTAGSTLSGTNPGTSLIAPGQATQGTPSAAVTLQ